MGDFKAALRLARARQGVLTREDLTDLGYSPRNIETWVGRGILVPVGRKVLLLCGTEVDFPVRSLIAARRAGREACLTGQSALAVSGVVSRAPWDALPEPGTPWLLHHRPVDVGACIIRRHEDRYRTKFGVRVATTDVVMLDLLRYLPEAQARDLTFRALGRSEWEPFLARLGQHADALGRARGVRRLRQLSEIVESAARSAAEERVHSLLQEAGITGWRANYPLRVRGQKVILDLAFPEQKVFIEIDGRAYHGLDRFQHDRTRQNLLVQAGWTVLRFTWEDVTRRPEHVVAQIRDVLESRQEAHD
ncbi:MAG: hypothetical protein QG597_966 [Actinomycetota bacterium]|nr:hypothetical protein [Actinomycetota bacterium]